MKSIKESASRNVAELEDVHVSANGAPILRGVSLSVSKGERVLITGPSGSGKTTILRVINGIETPDKGEAYLFGKPLSTLRDSKRAEHIKKHVGVGFQAPNLDTSFSVFENMIGLSHAFGKGGKEIAARAGWLAARLGLAHKLEQSAATLSGGEKLRVSLGRLLVPKPDLLLLDEPTSMVDPQGKAEIYGLVDELAGPDTTIVMVSHDTEAQAIASRRVEVVSGGIVRDQLTTPDPFVRAA